LFVLQIEFEQAPEDVAAKARCLLEPWGLGAFFLKSRIQEGSQGVRLILAFSLAQVRKICH